MFYTYVSVIVFIVSHISYVKYRITCVLYVYITLKDYGSVTMTTESNNNSAVTLSRMNFSGYVGHVHDYIQLNVYDCVLFSSRVGIRVRVRINILLVSSYAHLFIPLSVVTKIVILDNVKICGLQ